MKRIICLIMSLWMCVAVCINATATEEIINGTQNVGVVNETELIQETEKDTEEADNTETTEETEITENKEETENTENLEKNEEENITDNTDIYTENKKTSSNKGRKLIQARDGLEGFKEVDRITFKFIINDTFGEVLLGEIGDSGTEVEAELIHYVSENTIDYYYLTLSGNNGEITIWDSYVRSLSGSKEKYSTTQPICFPTHFRYEDGELYSYTDSSRRGNLFLLAKIKNEVAEEVAVSCDLTTQLTGKNKMKYAIECTDIEYEKYNDGYTLEQKFEEKDKEQLLDELHEESEKYDVPIQDPERYVTKFKGTINDGSVRDYYISFATESEMGDVDIDAAWYRNLGNNVKFSVIGFVRTLDGKELKSNRTMLRFKGDKGDKWFKPENLYAEKTSDTTSAIIANYKSLISFDGYELVQNTLKNDPAGIEMNFEGSEHLLKDITLTVEGETITFDEDEIKYIGGGKANYGKMW